MIGVAEPLHRSSTEGCPPLQFWWVGFRKRIGNELWATIRVISIPAIHKIAKRNPGILPLADLFKRQSHRLQPIKIHSLSPLVLYTKRPGFSRGHHSQSKKWSRASWISCP